MHGFPRPATLLAAALLGLGCDALPTNNLPEQVLDLDGLRLDVELDQAVVVVGDSATLTIRLQNSTAQHIELGFSSTCQILPFVETATGAMQYPGGGAWGCGQALTSLTVPANGEVTRTLLLRSAENPTGIDGTLLRPGRYRIYARMEAATRKDDVGTPQLPPDRRQLRSPTIELEVR